MKDVDLLSDIDKDISGDWKNIQVKIKNDKEKKEIDHLLKNKNRWHMPRLDRFIESLKKITYEGSKEAVLIELQVLAHRILMENEHGEKLPKSFEKVWELFCDTYKYNCSTITCNACRKTYNIFYEREGEQVRYAPWDFVSRSMDFKRSELYCINCGHRFVFYGDEILGVFGE